LSRCRLDNLCGSVAFGKSRSCLDRVAVGKEEGFHLEEVGAAEATAETSLQVAREIHDDLLAVPCARSASLSL
jgi:hypothetical protein